MRKLTVASYGALVAGVGELVKADQEGWVVAQATETVAGRGAPSC